MNDFSVTTLNACGLRSALKKGLLGWLERHAPDVVLLQETRSPPMPEVFLPLGYHSEWHPAEKPGYSGVALLSKTPPDAVTRGMAGQADPEGRLLSARFGSLSVMSAYLPSGSSGEARQRFKDEYLLQFTDFVRSAVQAGPLVIGGDLNVAHRELDIKNWRSNRQSSGFLPHERAWMSDLLSLGLTDTHRAALGEQSEYTWWSTRGQAYTNDVGWRIDYLLAAGMQAEAVTVDRAARLSDHAPLSARLRTG